MEELRPLLLSGLAGRSTGSILVAENSSDGAEGGTKQNLVLGGRNFYRFE